jgi:hypothetical protein
MTFEQFLQKVDKYYYDNEPHQRYGQGVMNVLHDVYPDWRKRIVGTDLDCFYDDGIVRFTLEYLEKEWNDKIV